MVDRYQAVARTPLGRLLVNKLGLPNPPVLERYREGGPLVDGVVRLAGARGGRLIEPVTGQLGDLGVMTAAGTHAVGETLRGLIFDATGIASSQELVALHEFFTPVLRDLHSNGRIVVLGRPPESTHSIHAHVAQRALEGFTRSLAKEVGGGSTVQLVYVAPGAEDALTSTLAFVMSAKSAYVSAQVIRIGTTDSPHIETVSDLARPLTGKVALVTGASRGIGAAIARTMARDGATVVGLDIPALASDLGTIMEALGGDSIVIDITSPDAPQRIARHAAERHGGVDVVVHNAGVNRDRRLVNMKADGWRVPLAVNLTAPERITTVLLERELIHPNGRIIGVASIAGIAGNKGQTNYAASKAGVIGLMQSLAPTLEGGITANAVAPGFIETQMTARLPLLVREAGRRMNSMAQGGLPVDVAETVAWLAHPGSAAVNGNVVRVCGQSLLGA